MTRQSHEQQLIINELLSSNEKEVLSDLITRKKESVKHFP
jgi:hypothetical protein